jgi:hypothetical protein
MAEGSRTSRRQGNGTASEAAAERETGERVILRRERVIVLPDDVVAGDVDATKLREALGLKSAKVATADVGREAWVEVARVTAKDKRSAIRQHAGEPNTPDAKHGAYRAPTVSSWAGGMEYERPPQPKVEAKPLD